MSKNIVENKMDKIQMCRNKTNNKVNSK